MVDARDIRESQPKYATRVKEKPSFEQREFVDKACSVLINTGEYHIDFGPLMFNFKVYTDHEEDYVVVTISSKRFKTAPFKLTNEEGEYRFYTYANAFFTLQDFIEELQYEKEIYLPNQE